ncbi:hypothetical protein Scep_001134 [Stephania cephalantha]|uniref:PXMP2/4 family protein 4 n=1 Tax=Stephania cephalantha TaxID=152367 RepID=A0AAP0L7F0_9MAGN
MSFVFIRNGVKSLLSRSPLQTHSIIDHRLAFREATTMVSNQQSRAYTGFRLPSVFGRLKEPATISRSRSYCTSSSSSSRNGFVGWYLGVIKSHPLITKAITSGVIYTAADCTSQALTLKPSDSFDLVRTMRMAGYGMLIVGPSLHYWFNFVSRILPYRDTVSTVKKILMGQLLYGPVINVTFYSVNAKLQGESGSEIVARLKRDLLPTLKNNAIYWPLCDFVTFKFVPVHLQPLTNNAFAYLWTIYLTYMASLTKVDSVEALAD